MFSGGNNIVKVKAKGKIPRWDSYKQLGFKNWEKLNNGEIVELKKVPEIAKEYLEIIKKEK